MARLINRLNVSKIRTAPIGMHCDGGGLYLQCSPGAKDTINRSWLFRFAINGRERAMGLGPVAVVTLAEARERAAENRRLLFRNVDPLENKDSQRAAKVVTFDTCAALYIKSHQSGWRNEKHTKQWVSSLATYASPYIGALPVQSVDVASVLKVLQPIWATKAETARRVRARVEAILDFAKASGLCHGENPARLKGNLDHLLAKNGRCAAHHAALAYTEVPGLMADLHQRDDLPALALMFTILTAARTGEVLGARWQEIDALARLWTVPASRMKSGVEHRVPLSNPALVILNKAVAIRHNDFVFPGDRQRHLPEAAMRSCLQRLRLGVTVHGLRSSFRDWSAECTSFRPELAEMALAHSVGGAVERAYRRSDMLEQRRLLMEQWAGFITHS